MSVSTFARDARTPAQIREAKRILSLEKKSAKRQTQGAIVEREIVGAALAVHAAHASAITAATRTVAWADMGKVNQGQASTVKRLADAPIGAVAMGVQPFFGAIALAVKTTFSPMTFAPDASGNDVIKLAGKVITAWLFEDGTWLSDGEAGYKAPSQNDPQGNAGLLFLP